MEGIGQKIHPYIIDKTVLKFYIGLASEAYMLREKTQTANRVFSTTNQLNLLWINFEII